MKGQRCKPVEEPPNLVPCGVARLDVIGLARDRRRRAPLPEAVQVDIKVSGPVCLILYQILAWKGERGA